MVFDFSAIRVPRQKHYSDSTLMTWNKKELIEYIRMLEHNYDVSIQFNENQAQYIECFCPFFKADRKTENSSEKPNNCETCKHWEHGAHSHYYCAKLAMRQECKYEPKVEPQTDEEQFCIEHKCTYYRPKEGGCTKNNGDCPFDEPQTDCAWK